MVVKTDIHFSIIWGHVPGMPPKVYAYECSDGVWSMDVSDVCLYSLICENLCSASEISTRRERGSACANLNDVKVNVIKQL